MDKFNPSIRIGKKDDSSDICGIIVGSRQAGLSFSETVNLLGFFHTPFLDFRASRCDYVSMVQTGSKQNPTTLACFVTRDWTALPYLP